MLNLKTDKPLTQQSPWPKFGVNKCRPRVFQEWRVDNRGVATSIVSSRDLKLPSMV